MSLYYNNQVLASICECIYEASSNGSSFNITCANGMKGKYKQDIFVYL